MWLFGYEETIASCQTDQYTQKVEGMIKCVAEKHCGGSDKLAEAIAAGEVWEQIPLRSLLCTLKNHF